MSLARHRPERGEGLEAAAKVFYGTHGKHRFQRNSRALQVGKIQSFGNAKAPGEVRNDRDSRVQRLYRVRREIISWMGYHFLGLILGQVR